MLKFIADNEKHVNQIVALQIRKHVETRGHERNVIITKRMAKLWWNRLNKAVFNGMLHEPRIDVLNVVSDVDTYGEHHAHEDDDGSRYTVIRLKKKLDTRKVFLCTLVHEMVHQWEWEQFGRTTHHKYFFMWKDVIRQAVDLPLSTHVDDFIDD